MIMVAAAAAAAMGMVILTRPLAPRHRPLSHPEQQSSMMTPVRAMVFLQRTFGKTDDVSYTSRVRCGILRRTPPLA